MYRSPELRQRKLTPRPSNGRSTCSTGLAVAIRWDFHRLAGRVCGEGMLGAKITQCELSDQYRHGAQAFNAFFALDLKAAAPDDPGQILWARLMTAEFLPEMASPLTLPRSLVTAFGRPLCSLPAPDLTGRSGRYQHASWPDRGPQNVMRISSAITAILKSNTILGHRRFAGSRYGNRCH